MIKKTKSQVVSVTFILTLVHFIHLVDFVVMMPLGPALIEIFNLTPGKFSALISVYNIAGGVTGIVFSFYSNLFQKKYALTFSLVGLGICTIATGLSTNYQSLFLSRLLTGIFGGMLNPLVFAIVADLIPFKQRGKAMGWIMSGFSMASVFGVPLGLWLNDQYGLSTPFILIGSFSIIVSFVCFFTLPDIFKIPQTLNIRELFKEMKISFSNSQYIRCFVLIFILSGSMFLLIPLLSPFAVSNMGMAQEDLKYMYLIGGALTIFTARLFGVLTDKLGAKKMFNIICIMSFIPILLFTSSGKTSFVNYIIVGSFFMSFVSGRMIPIMTYVSAVPNKKDRNRFMGLLNSIRGFGSALFAYFSGLFVTATPTGELLHFDIVGIAAILISLAAIWLFNSLNSRETIV